MQVQQQVVDGGVVDTPPVGPVEPAGDPWAGLVVAPGWPTPDEVLAASLAARLAGAR